LDLERLAKHDEGQCLICKLPHVEGEGPGSKYEPSGTNDCLDHLRQYVFCLENHIAGLVTRVEELERRQDHTEKDVFSAEKLASRERNYRRSVESESSGGPS
jgi:hypothetical protein